MDNVSDGIYDVSQNNVDQAIWDGVDSQIYYNIETMVGTVGIRSVIAIDNSIHYCLLLD